MHCSFISYSKQIKLHFIKFVDRGNIKDFIMQPPKVTAKSSRYIITSYIRVHVATISIQQKAIDCIKTALQFWFRYDVNNNKVCAVSFRHCY